MEAGAWRHRCCSTAEGRAQGVAVLVERSEEHHVEHHAENPKNPLRCIQDEIRARRGNDEEVRGRKRKSEGRRHTDGISMCEI